MPMGQVRPSPVDLLLVADVPLTGQRLRDGPRYARVRAGVYAPHSTWQALAPWDRYLARVHAYALVNSDAVFSHESSAALMGLPIFGEPRDIHIHDPDRARSRRFGDVCVHTSVDPPVTERRGFAHTTSAAQTAVDLMRVLPPAFALAVADAAISPFQGGTNTIDDLRAIAAVESDRRGRGQLAVLWPLVDARAESVGESVSRAVMLWAGFEEPELQVEIVSEGCRDRVDFGWRTVRALGESDGYEKYRGESADDTVARVIDEKRREDRLRRECRAFGRWDWSAAVAVKPLTDRLDSMGVPRMRPQRPALLATLGTNPRSAPSARNRKPADTSSTA
ncbi:hypothetical protein GCM10009776_02370 [Microbacterium deminutum]|uniref:Uncharacterized protein n=2 Tax=Microbacterium deminutum TaxID=344164 RepID=A0ABP5BH73_9MICO